MNKYIITFWFLLLGIYSNAQVIRIAIIDFDNISGIAKYDGLGKAMSSMLISDIESNVSSKRFQLVERVQINKIIKEQNLQKSSSFDKNTSVKMGKLLGVDYLLIGDIFVLDNSLVINTRLTEVSSSNIKFSEKKEGKLNEWLSLKTLLAKSVSSSLAMPFTEPLIPDVSITPAILTTYANAVDENDKGNFNKAETLISAAKEFNPEFKYLDDLKDVVEKLKKQVAEQGKKIEVLEKSGGRIINAKSYVELSNNLKNELTTYEEKKKIFVTIINQFPDQLYKDDLLYFLYPFYLKNPGGLSLKNCSVLLQDILKLRELINKDKLSYFDKNMYFLTGKSLDFLTQRIYLSHDFSDNEYLEFIKIMDLIIKNAFNEKSEQLFASLNLFSNFNYELNKNFKPNVKKDIIENQKKIYILLRYPYFEKILEKCTINASENLSNLESSKNIIYFLAGNSSELKNVMSIYSAINNIQSFEKSFKYHNQNNNQNKDEIQNYIYELHKICVFFGVILEGVTNTYLFDYRQDGKVLIEIPQAIPVNEIVRRKIISLDSISRRSNRIQMILDKKGFTDPCEITKLQNQLISQSDSIGIISEVYLLNNEFPTGKTIEVIFNNKRDTITAHILGKKITNSENKFEIIYNDKLKNLDKSSPVVFHIRGDRFSKYSDLNLNPIEDFLKEKKIECEQLQTSLKIKEERAVKRAKQEEIRKQDENQKLNAQIERQKKASDFFKQNNIYVDSTNYGKIIRKIKQNELTLDSLFNLGYLILLNENNFKKDKINSPNELSAQLSILLNINYITQIEQLEMQPINIKNYVNAATINLAHGYLLCSIIYHANAYNLTETEYNKIQPEFKFNEIFEGFSRNQMILHDWNEFIEKGIVTKTQLKEFNNKFKILPNF